MGKLLDAARRFQDDVLGELLAHPENYSQEAAEALREVVYDLVRACERIET